MDRFKKWLTIALAAVLVLGSMTGTVWTEEVNTAKVFEAEYLPAPAVAGLLLEAVGVCNRYGTGRDGGNYIRDVANHMGPGTDFYGVCKYDPFHYAVAVAEYLNTNNPQFPAGVISPWKTAIIDLTVIGAPTQTVYSDQESLCLDGLVVELSVKLPWSDAATIPVAYADFAEYYLTADPDHGQTLGTDDIEVKITHTPSDKIASQYITVQSIVTFEDWNGAVLAIAIVEHGSDATAPSVDPQRTGYTFTGWDTDFTHVTESLTVTAQYTLNTYTVTFEDWNGAVLAVEIVEHGSDATAPSVDPQRTGYTFTGWDTDFTHVTESLTVTAQYRLDTLYLRGDQIIPFIPGFTQNSGSQSFEYDHLHLEADGASRSERTYVTAVPINLTDVKFIYVRWENDGSLSSSNLSELIVSTEQSKSCLTANLRLGRSSIFNETNMLYVFDLKGNYYIRVHAHTHSTALPLTSNLKVYEITLKY